MKFLLINLAVDTSNNSFHRLNIAQKIDFIENCILQCSGEISRIPDGQPFKAILVAPEYFFARCCPETEGLGGRHYEYDHYLEIRRRLTSLSRRRRDVLIIAGTIAWKSPIVKGTIRPPLDWTPPNAAPVPSLEKQEFSSETKYIEHMRSIGEVDEKGVVTKSWRAYEGEAADADLLKTCGLLKTMFSRYSSMGALNRDQKLDIIYQCVMNVGPSGDDYIRNIQNAMGHLNFARNTAFFYLGGRKVGQYTKHSDYQEDFQSQAISNERSLAINDDGNSILNICGLKIGVEICFDHNLDILRDYIETSRVTPDIHLILSATVKNKPLVTRRGVPIVTTEGLPIRIHSSTPLSGNTQLPNARQVRRTPITVNNDTVNFEVVIVDLPNLSANAVPMAKTDTGRVSVASPLGIHDAKHVATTTSSNTRNTIFSHNAGSSPAVGVGSAPTTSQSDTAINSNARMLPPNTRFSSGSTSAASSVAAAANSGTGNRNHFDARLSPFNNMSSGRSPNNIPAAAVKSSGMRHPALSSNTRVPPAKMGSTSAPASTAAAANLSIRDFDIGSPLFNVSPLGSSHSTSAARAPSVATATSSGMHYSTLPSNTTVSPAMMGATSASSSSAAAANLSIRDFDVGSPLFNTSPLRSLHSTSAARAPSAATATNLGARHPTTMGSTAVPPSRGAGVTTSRVTSRPSLPSHTTSASIPEPEPYNSYRYNR
jgi:predicted amidohydrolase